MEDEHSGLGFERVVFFSDAVFAIVITLLVLPLTSELLLPKDGDTAAQVLAVLPRIATFVVSFLVVGQFWVAHHRTFGRIRRADSGWCGSTCSACSPWRSCRSPRRCSATAPAAARTSSPSSSSRRA
jgi:uncharacterized membrane protein